MFIRDTDVLTRQPIFNHAHKPSRFASSLDGDAPVAGSGHELAGIQFTGTALG
jgi:hypothetical protein